MPAVTRLRLPSLRRRTSRLVRDGIAIGMAIIGLLLVWTGLAGPSSHPDEAVVAPPTEQTRQPTSSGSPEPTPRTPAGTDRGDLRDQIRGPVLPEADPVSVAIPRIRVRSRLVDLGVDRDGVMEVPDDPAVAGWFSRGATPGALGPAVIAGHVTWDGAPAVFHRLSTLRRGDRVSVARSDGRVAVFTVDRVARFSKSHFPSEDVYGSIDHAGLRLITCGGTYDAAEHRYLDNIVVFARLESVRQDRN